MEVLVSYRVASALSDKVFRYSHISRSGFQRSRGHRGHILMTPGMQSSTMRLYTVQFTLHTMMHWIFTEAEAVPSLHHEGPYSRPTFKGAAEKPGLKGKDFVNSAMNIFQANQHPKCDNTRQERNRTYHSLSVYTSARSNFLTPQHQALQL